MNSAVVWFTLVVLFGALTSFSYGLASVFQLRAENWVRRWEQETPVTSHSDDNTRQLLKHTETSLNSTQCGYQACDTGKEGYINVHLVPHTHDDVGWLKTVDQYYYGARNSIQDAGVQYILDTVLDELQKDDTRRFIYVEVAFFSRWWREQHDFTRHRVQALVNAGRLEFILGGWCMNDEASTHYSGIIDQHTLGFQFLKRNFGECGRPRVAWQIDPFGHSREQASLFAQMGFDGLFFARLDYQDYSRRKQAKEMELMWRGSQSLGDQASLFTGVLFGPLYGPPAGFRFEGVDTPMMDDRRLEDYNVDDKVKDFLANVTSQAEAYTTNHVMLTMGGDFQYQNARINYKNIDKLIEYMNSAAENAGTKVYLMYSTPSCYLYAVNKANNSYTHKEDDFFPYASAAHAFWTGYFTSRPSLKGYERSTNNFFQVCRQLDALTLLGPEHGSDKKLLVLRDALGVVQHHDAVSGTEQQHVADDYAKRLATGVAECEDVVNTALGKLLPVSSSVSPPALQFCTLLNVSYCSVTETTQQFAIVMYNPFGRNVSTWIRVPVSGKSYAVSDYQMHSVSSQIVPLSEATLELPDHKGSNATGSLVFLANIPPLGFTTYFVKKASLGEETAKPSLLHRGQQDDVTIRNQHLAVTFDGPSGLMKSLTNTGKQITLDVVQTLLYYKSYPKVDKDWPPSGAYIFRSANTTVYPLTDTAQITVVQGLQVQEVRQKFGDWGSQIVRLYNDSKYVEIEWTVGPIPFSDKVGREVISRFTTSLQTNATFYTDSNGREILQRIRDYRSTWKLNQTETVAGNYYPVNSRIYIQDKARNIQLTVLTDRSQGGASLHDGEIELMLHRRLVSDDSLGVDEPLNETGVDGRGLIVRGKHYVYLDNIAASVQLHRDKAQKLYMAPSLAFTPLQTSMQDYRSSFHTQWSGMKRPLPDNVHLLTLEQWEAGTVLLRLEHFYAKDEDPVLSQPAKVQLKDLFVPFGIKSVEELTLGANQKLSDAKRLQWNVKDFGKTAADLNSFVVPYNQTTLEVVLNPMQIRTFQVTLE